MRRIATHCAIDQLNAARKRRWLQVEDVGQAPLSAEAMRSGPATGPADPALADHIRRAFAALPPKLRVVAILTLIEELPHAEIADALGVPIGTVKSRLFRATRELRSRLMSVGIQV